MGPRCFKPEVVPFDSRNCCVNLPVCPGATGCAGRGLVWFDLRGTQPGMPRIGPRRYTLVFLGFHLVDCFVEMKTKTQISVNISLTDESYFLALGWAFLIRQVPLAFVEKEGDMALGMILHIGEDKTLSCSVMEAVILQPTVGGMIFHEAVLLHK